MKDKSSIFNWMQGRSAFEDISHLLNNARQDRCSWSNFYSSDININIFVRSNINWGYTTLEHLLLASQQSHFPSHLLQGIMLWEENFDISFFNYRMKLQEMAELCWSRICRVDSILKNSLAYIDMLVSYNPSQRFILIPTDDDDWFAPHISRVLEDAYNNNVDADVITWRGAELDYANGYNCKMRNWFATNTYAFTDIGLRKLKKLGSDVLDILVRRHAAAGRFYSEFQSQYNIVHLDFEECYSVKNSSPASVLNVQRLAEGDLTIKELEQLANQEFGDIPVEMAWAKEYFDVMQGLKIQLNDKNE